MHTGTGGLSRPAASSGGFAAVVVPPARIVPTAAVARSRVPRAGGVLRVVAGDPVVGRGPPAPPPIPESPRRSACRRVGREPRPVGADAGRAWRPTARG
ncbi:hypothetical protein ACFW9X_40585, partial [Streptomyces sp. NPDC059466]